jgi:hypothetical protein
MISTIVSLLEKMGLNAFRLKLSITLLVVAFGSYHTAIYFEKNKQESKILGEVVVGLTRIEAKVDNINKRIDSVDGNVISLSQGTEKIAEAQMSFLKPFTVKNEQLIVLYQIKLDQIRDYQKEYLPHNQPEIKIGIRKQNNGTNGF